MNQPRPSYRRIVSSFRPSVRPALLSVCPLLITLVLIAFPLQTEAHANLDRADPAPDALLAAPPRTIDIWLTEPVAEESDGRDAFSIRVLDQSSRDLTVSDQSIVDGDRTHIRAAVRGVGTGTYTVVWSNRSATDGHTISGSYAFRVASSTRAPGAATTDADNPAAWAVLTRWLTFFGAAVIAGGFAIGWFALGADESTVARRRRMTMIALGAVVALIATAIEPVLQTWRPEPGVTATGFADSLHALPNAWWCRPVAAFAAILISAWAWRQITKEQQLSPITVGLGVIAGLGILLGLSLTSHAAGRADWRSIALTSNVLHQWAAALWVGGLVTLAVWWPNRPEDSSTAVVRRFSRLALGLALVGIVTGVVNAGFVLPRLRSLWTSTYGDILIVKVAIVVPVLALATFHRASLRRISGVVGGLRPAVRQTIRIETALVVLVVLGGSVLALLAPPSVRVAEANRATRVDLRQPILADTPGQETWVHLTTEPAVSGPNRFGVTVKNGDGSIATADPPTLIRLTFTNLEQPMGSVELDTEPRADGTFTATGNPLSLDGWWRIDVTLRWLGREDTVVTYYLLLPDPNLQGLDAPVTRPTNPEAQALYEQAMVKYTGIHRVRYRQLMLDHRGTGVLSEHIVNDGSDGSPAGYIYRNITINGWEAIVLSDKMWTRYPGEAWEESVGQEMIPPSRWDEEYSGATGFQLGRIEEIDGEPSQVVSFVVPEAPNRTIAWYVWWVGTETGLVRRDAMISRSHYMVSFFSDFDAPFTIDVPSKP